MVEKGKEKEIRWNESKQNYFPSDGKAYDDNSVAGKMMSIAGKSS